MIPTTPQKNFIHKYFNIKRFYFLLFLSFFVTFNYASAQNANTPPKLKTLNAEELISRDPMGYLPAEINSVCQVLLYDQAQIYRGAFEVILGYQSLKSDKSQSPEIQQVIQSFDKVWKAKGFSTDDIQNFKASSLEKAEKHVYELAFLLANDDLRFADIQKQPFPPARYITGQLVDLGLQKHGPEYLMKMANWCSARVRMAIDSFHVQSSSDFKQWNMSNPPSDVKNHKMEYMLDIYKDIDSDRTENIQAIRQKDGVRGEINFGINTIALALDPLMLQIKK